MPTDKQIEAAHEAANKVANNHTYVSEASIIAALTAAEQAEPAPILPEMPDDDRDFTPELARKIIAKYQDYIRSQPTPAARSGAVKVKQLEWSVNWNIVKAETPIGHYFITAGQHSGFECRLEEHWRMWARSEDEAKAAAQADYERRILAALEPAEPETDAEPVAWSYEVANYIDNDGSYTGWVGPRLSFQKPNAPEGSIRNATPLYTRPPESRLREALVAKAKEAGLLSVEEINEVYAALAQGADDELA